jgi:DNA-binding transcriptional LysR family regulator
MDWRDWDMFCHVVDHGGFTAAARALGQPKSTLSAAVRRLESDVGLRLLERTTRRLRLTEAGEAVYHRVGPLFAALRDARNESMAACGTVTGVLRIASPYEFGAHHVGPVACALMARYPDLRVRIDVEHEIVDPIAGNYDMVFAMLEAPLPSSAIVIRKVFSLGRGLYAAPSLLEGRGEPRTAEDLAALPLLAGPGDTEWTLTDRNGAVQRIATAGARLVSSNAGVRLQAALAGHGVLRVTASYVRAALETGALRQLLPDHVCEPLNVHALLPARRLMPEKVRCFLDAMEEHARSAGPKPAASPVAPSATHPDGEVRLQRPTNRGGRLALKASTPSRKSSDCRRRL